MFQPLLISNRYSVHNHNIRFQQQLAQNSCKSFESHSSLYLFQRLRKIWKSLGYRLIYSLYIPMLNITIDYEALLFRKYS